MDLLELISEIKERVYPSKRERSCMLSKHLKQELICEIDSSTKEEAVAELVNLLVSKVNLEEGLTKELLEKAILDREAIVSTGIGKGVAIPHARLDCKNFYLIIGVKKGKGIAWGNFGDEKAVNLIFLMGGPKDQQEGYLGLLSQITKKINEADTVDKFTKRDVMKVFLERKDGSDSY